MPLSSDPDRAGDTPDFVIKFESLTFPLGKSPPPPLIISIPLLLGGDSGVSSIVCHIGSLAAAAKSAL